MVNDLTRSDFQEEGTYQWVAHKGGYRIVVRHYDGGYEVVIREELASNPTVLEWQKALKMVNKFYSLLRISRERGHGYSADIRRYHEDGSDLSEEIEVEEII